MFSSTSSTAASSLSIQGMTFQRTVSPLVVIDAGVADYQQLMAGLVEGAAVLLLNDSQDGIAQITSALQQFSGINQLHIIAHGSPGTLHIGNGALNLSNLDQYRPALASWFRSPGSELLLYGCNVAAGDAGEEFITKLQAATQANIAASTTKVGSSLQGGNWSLDVATVGFTPQLAISATTQSTYAGTFDWFEAEKLLADATVNNIAGNNNDVSDTSEGDLDSFDQFGSAVAIYDGFAIVGVPQNFDVVDPNTGTIVPGRDVGSVYVFTVDSTTGDWSRETQLVASDPVASALFGASVDATSIGDNLYVAIGAPGAQTPSPLDPNVNESTGAAYIFERNAAGVWSQVQKISHTETDPPSGTSSSKAGDQFGASIGIDGNTIVVGSPNDNRPGTGAQTGAIYLFETPAGTTNWAQTNKISNPNPNPESTLDRFGASVAIADGLIIAGAPNADVPGPNGALVTGGAAYIFDASTGVLQGSLTASDTASSTGQQAPENADGFGTSVDIVSGAQGTYAIVGTPGNDVVVGDVGNQTTFTNAGSAYVFAAAGGGWSQVQQLTGSDGVLRAGDQFGISVGIDDGVAIVGAYTEEDNYDDPTFANEDPNTRLPRPGVTYIYELNDAGTSWEQEDRLTASDKINSDSFGNAVDVYTSPLGSSTAVVGASTKNFVRDGNDFIPGAADGRDDISQAGAAYIYLSQPQVQSVTPNVFYINDQLIAGANPEAPGQNQFTLTVVYDQPMNQAINPTITFPNPNESPGLTLANNAVPVGGIWTAPNTYVAIYDLVDAELETINIDIAVNGGFGVGGAPQAPAEPPNAVVTDIFSIDTRNPIPLVFNPFEARGTTDPSQNAPQLPSTFINRPFSVAGNFDEQISPAVNPFDVNSFVITNGVIANGNAPLSDFFFDGGGTYNFNVTPIAEGEVTVSLNPFKASDLRFNPAQPVPPSIVLTYDITPPEVAISPNGFDPAAGPLNGPFSVLINFSEVIVGFDASDVIVTNAVIQPGSFVQNSPTQFALTVDPTVNGAVENLPIGVDIIQGVATDRATNPNNQASQVVNVTYDGLSPTVTLAANVGNTVDGSFSLGVFFTEAVTGLEATDFVVTNGAAVLLSGSGSTYSIEIAPTLAGPVTVSLPASIAQDVATNGNIQSNLFTVDYVPPFPQVLSVTPSDLLISDALTGSTSWTLTVVFSEEMDPSAVPQFGFIAGGVDVSPSLTPSTGSWVNNTTYIQSYTVVDTNIDVTDIDVTVSGGVSQATAQLQQPNPAVVEDVFAIDTNNPVLTLTADPVDPLTVIVTSSDPITDLGEDDVQVINGEVIGGSFTVNSPTSYAFRVQQGAGDDPAAPIDISVIAGAATEVESGNLSQASATVRIDEINDPPEITVPVTTTLDVTGNEPFIFSQANGNAISIFDSDSGFRDISVTLTGVSGSILVNAQPDVVITGNGTNSVTLRGSLTDLNTTLDGVAFRPVNVDGPGSLTIEVDDEGNIGIGGPKTDTEIVNFDITASQELTRHDFDNDGFSDFLWRDTRSTSPGTVVLWNMDGAVFNNRGAIIAEVPNQDFQIQGTGDFNLDGKTDIVWRNFATGSTFVWLMDGEDFLGRLDINSSVPQDSGWFVESVADINGDGNQDLLWRNRSTNTIVAWYLESGTIGSDLQLVGGGVLGAPGLDWQIQGMGDFNSDSNPDVAWRNTVTGATAIWYMDGLTLLPGSGVAIGGTTTPSPGLEWDIQGVGDYNADGIADVVWRNPGASETVIWMMGNNGTSVLSGPIVNESVPAGFELGLN